MWPLRRRGSHRHKTMGLNRCESGMQSTEVNGHGRRILTLLVACGLATGINVGISGTTSVPPAAGATGFQATVGGWKVLAAAGSLPTLSRPAELAVGARGNVYVADNGNHRIVEIAPDGRLLAHFGDADLRSQGASGLAVSAGGTVYV